MLAADFESRVFALWRYFLIGIAAAELCPSTKRFALPAFAAGVTLLAYDLGGEKHDWAANLGIGVLHRDGQTLGLGIASGLILAALPHLDRISRTLDVVPLRILGVISYSVYIIQFFYIYANFREIKLFTALGTMDMHNQFKALPQQRAWICRSSSFPAFSPGRRSRSCWSKGLEFSSADGSSIAGKFAHSPLRIDLLD